MTDWYLIAIITGVCVMGFLTACFLVGKKKIDKGNGKTDAITCRSCGGMVPKSEIEKHVKDLHGL